MESGYARLPNGQLHVAAQSSMPGCHSKMIDCWFGYVRTTAHYKMWHPIDRVWCDWVGLSGEYIGGTRQVHEYVGGKLNKLRIRFRPPEEYIDTLAFAEANVGAAIRARTGQLDEELWVGHLIHLVRDTDYGCEMRSWFWIGDFAPNIASDPGAVQKLIPDSVGAGLLKHCNEEVGYLAGFLPYLYRGRNVG